MPKLPFTAPIEDSVPKVNEEVAVGEDLEFQRKWWRFETGVWIAFALLIALAIAGVFGRGPVAKSKIRASDGSLAVTYDHIQRTGTPSSMTVQFNSAAVQDGKARIFVSESLIRQLGAQRIAPQPETSVVGKDGLMYTFPANDHEGRVVISLEPSGPGIFPFSVNTPGGASVQSKVIVMP